MTPLARSMEHFRELGYEVCKSEHWNGFARRRVDLFGFIDAVALKENEIVAIQATSNSNVSARVEKIKALKTASVWLSGLNRRIVVHGWAKKGPRGKAKRWELREVEIGAINFGHEISDIGPWQRGIQRK